jgi:hypothetical protein
MSTDRAAQGQVNYETGDLIDVEVDGAWVKARYEGFQPATGTSFAPDNDSRLRCA